MSLVPCACYTWDMAWNISAVMCDIIRRLKFVHVIYANKMRGRVIKRLELAVLVLDIDN